MGFHTLILHLYFPQVLSMSAVTECEGFFNFGGLNLKMGNATSNISMGQLYELISGLQASMDTMQASMGTKEDMKAVRDDMKKALKAVRADISYDLSSLQRKVDAIESTPVPYGRPKAYHSEARVHSVSGSRLSRTGRF